MTHIGSGETGSASNDARRCCRRLTELWAGQANKDGKDKSIELEAEREAVALELDAETLVDGLYAATAKQLGESPDSFFTRLITPALEKGSSGEAVQQVTDKVDELLGVVAGPKESAGVSRTPLTAAVQQKAVERAATISTALIDWLLDLVETPGKRPQAAERGAAWLGQHLRGLTDHLRGELTQAGNQAFAHRQLLLTGKPASKGGGIRWLGLSRSAEEAPAPERKLVEYGKLRLREVALANALNVPGTVQERLGRFLPDLAQCRQKLRQFSARFRGKSDELDPILGLNGRGAEGASIPAEVLRAFDEAVQSQLLEPHGGLWSVFAGSHAIRRSVPREPGVPAEPAPAGHATLLEEVLKELLLTRARSFLREAIPDRNAAQSFLEDHGGAEEARPVLLHHLEQATPRLRVEGGRERLLLGAPDGPAKAAFLQCVTEAIPDLPITAVQSEEDLFLVYEGAGYAIGEMAAALIGPDAPDPELVQRVMTRQDVNWSTWSAAPA
jgi:hypothetical protein